MQLLNYSLAEERTRIETDFQGIAVLDPRTYFPGNACVDVLLAARHPHIAEVTSAVTFNSELWGAYSPEDQAVRNSG
jgi:hypothetical protein